MSAEAATTESSPLHAALGQAIADAIHQALEAGLEVDQAACITVAVAADYARATYGPDYLNALAKVVIRQAAEPLPFEWEEEA
jgi:hypothetical protein